MWNAFKTSGLAESREVWCARPIPAKPRKRDTAGEHAPVMFLKDGRLAVVTTIQDLPARGGFAFRTVQ
jgi:hypothetical protein